MVEQRQSGISTAWGWVGAVLIAVAILAALGVGLWIYFIGNKQTRHPAGTPQSTLILRSDRVQVLPAGPVTSLKSHPRDWEVEKYHAS